MNWGKGLLLTMAGFVAMMAWFLVRAAQNPEPLVTENYYEQELKYQERIDATQRALALAGTLSMEPSPDGVRLGLPSAIHGKEVNGRLLLLRPNAPEADRTVGIMGAASDSMMLPTDLRTGRYVAQLEWTMDGEQYFAQRELLVP